MKTVSCMIKNNARSFLLDQITLIKSLLSFSEPTMSETKVTRKPKYDGRTKKRQWEERRTDKGAGLERTPSKIPKTNQVPTIAPQVEKIKRRKFALLMGYSGVDYYGMQKNPNTKTIEGDLFQALLDANFINEECFNQVQNMQFQRAARTDKGVSAARQVVSMKLGENFDLNQVNERLKETIRIFGIKRVTKGFNAKSQCDGRTYIYICPTIALADQSESLIQKGFRIPEETITRANELLQLYVGTKNYHNFTVKKKPNDPSAKRLIRSFVCEPPFIVNDVEFCVLKINGQSFMMHQIRRMVGLMLAVMRGITSQETIVKALTEETVNIPRAPGLGLLLDYVHYQRYNFKYGEDGMHEKLTWEEVDKEVEEFKNKHIVPVITDTEIKEESMIQWIQNRLSRHSYDDLDAKGESDDEAGGDDDGEEQENLNAPKLKAESSV